MESHNKKNIKGKNRNSHPQAVSNRSSTFASNVKNTRNQQIKYLRTTFRPNFRTFEQETFNSETQNSLPLVYGEHLCKVNNEINEINEKIKLRLGYDEITFNYIDDYFILKNPNRYNNQGGSLLVSTATVQNEQILKEEIQTEFANSQHVQEVQPKQVGLFTIGGNYSKIDELKLDKSIKKYINILGKKRRIYTKIGSKKEYIKTKNHFVLIKDFIKLHSKSSIKPSKTIKDTKLPKSKPKPKVNKASQEDINISPKSTLNLR